MSADTVERATPPRPLRETEFEVLESIYAHRLMTTLQLRQLHAPGGATRTQRWMQQIVAYLHRRGLVAWVGRRGCPQLRCWYTTDAGAAVVDVAATRPHRRRVLVSADGAAGSLQSHTLAVNDVGVAFATWAKQLGHECGYLAWEHEVAHRISDRRGLRDGDLLIVDALLHYGAMLGGRVTLIYRFIELDRATMSTQEVGAKLRRYVTYSRYVPQGVDDGHEAWRDRYPGLPGVVVVLADKPRRSLLSRQQMLVGMCQIDPLIREAEAPSISIALLEDLQRHGPFAPIFCRPHNPDVPVDLLGRPGPFPEVPMAPTGADGQ